MRMFNICWSSVNVSVLLMRKTTPYPSSVPYSLPAAVPTSAYQHLATSILARALPASWLPGSCPLTGHTGPWPAWSPWGPAWPAGGAGSRSSVRSMHRRAWSACSVTSTASRPGRRSRYGSRSDKIANLHLSQIRDTDFSAFKYQDKSSRWEGRPYAEDKASFSQVGHPSST